jgi:hypothetical protein
MFETQAGTIAVRRRAVRELSYSGEPYFAGVFILQSNPEAAMPEQSTGPSAEQNSNSQSEHHRTVWILTLYAALFLALLGVMAYYVSSYLAQ